MSTYVDIHILQTVPPSNINRDDAGSPKSAIYGGVRRLRVSSQAWKRATRLDFEKHLDRSELGKRTKRVLQLLASEIEKQAPDLTEEALGLASDVFKAGKIKLTTPRTRKGEEPGPDESGYLLFLSARQIALLAELAIAAQRSQEKVDAKKVKAILTANNSVDIALFGRMVADDTDLNVDAACQVAHAISVHASETEFDYYTAVDDAKRESEDEDAGAGMIGTVEFSSATLYRYATVNLDQLAVNLGDREATLRALTTFIESFALAMPTGKQNSFANRTVPDLVLVQVRGDQPVSLVGAFEKAVTATPGAGFVDRAIEALGTYNSEIEEAYGLKPERSFTVCLGHDELVAPLGDKLPFPSLAQAVREAVDSSLLQDQ